MKYDYYYYYYYYYSCYYSDYYYITTTLVRYMCELKRALDAKGNAVLEIGGS